jgi:hypothetical protein
MKLALLAAKPVLEQLSLILEEEYEGLENEGRKKENYALPGWPYLQADIQGGKRIINNLHELLKSEERE